MTAKDGSSNELSRFLRLNLNRLLNDIYPQFDSHWQMTNCERVALIAIAEQLKPELSLEIGTYLGGSLQVLSRFSQQVISVDIDSTIPEKLAGKFSNVSFQSGDSATCLSEVVDGLNLDSKHVDFVLIDGDHSEAGVRRDIESVLRLVPQRRMVIILHDSFNPDCRAGMRNAKWNRCPYVQSVEIDFIPGVYHQVAFDMAPARTMWGGFACAVLEPIPRKGDLIVSEAQRGLFDAVFEQSAHKAPIHWSQQIPSVSRVMKSLLVRK